MHAESDEGDHEALLNNGEVVVRLGEKVTQGEEAVLQGEDVAREPEEGGNRSHTAFLNNAHTHALITRE